MRQKILIVEDEFIVANDLSNFLKREGYTVCGVAMSAQMGLTLADQHNPDLVILDIHLQGSNTGIDLAYDLRKRNIAYLFLSANSDQKTLEKAKETNPYAFLVKPFRDRDILVALEIAWHKHQHNQESRLKRALGFQADLSALCAKQDINESGQIVEFSNALQRIIPFDLLLFEKSDYQTFDQPHASLRTGFDEYQCLDLTAMTIISKLTKERFRGALNSLPGATRILQGPEFISFCRANSDLAAAMDTFKLSSLLVFQKDKIRLLLFCKKENRFRHDAIDILSEVHPVLQLCLSRIQENPVKDTGNLERSHFNPTGMVGKSHSLMQLLDSVRQIAPLDTSVLILGESGTGKEVIANTIHTSSPRKNQKLVKVNCGAIPHNLIESELFGHEKGAFTGALEKRIGKFQQANKGTLFLDEIGEMPLDLQVKLLRVLQEREVEPLGAKEPVKIDVRIIAATNKSLEKEVGEGRFRLDLYYRLNVFPIIVPPLRERREDIAHLANYFAAVYCSKFNKPFNGISQSMLEQLESYSWPGNIRELQNVIEQSTIINDGKSELQLMRPLSSASAAAHSLPEIKNLEQLKNLQQLGEKDFLISVLKQSNGRIRGSGGAAEILNMKPTTLESKLEKLGIDKKALFR